MAGRNPDDDAALARLRAADPGAGAEPDADRLATRTAQLRGEGADELAQRRERRRPWATVAAVAAGALVVGGAGFGLGRTTTPETLADGPATAEIGTDVTARTMAESQSGAADLSIAPAYGGRLVFTADGLSDAPGTAPAWAFDASSGFSAETVARVAAVLGVEGEPVEEEGMWRVGPIDGSAPSVTLSADGALSVGYSHPELYGYFGAAESSAADSGRAASGDGGGADAVAPAPAEPVDPVEPVQPVEPLEPAAPAEPAEPFEPGDAFSALRAVLVELGLDDGAVEYEAHSHGEGSPVVSVVGHQLLGGMRTGHMWNADVADGDLLSFHGPVAPVVALGEYDVVSPAQAVERLADPRFGAVSSGMPAIEPTMLPEPGWTWGEPPEAPPAPGSAIPWELTEVILTGSELTLTPHTTDGGATLLVPAYTLSDASGSRWTVLAVADHHLAF